MKEGLIFGVKNKRIISAVEIPSRPARMEAKNKLVLPWFHRYEGLFKKLARDKLRPGRLRKFE